MLVKTAAGYVHFSSDDWSEYDCPCAEALHCCYPEKKTAARKSPAQEPAADPGIAEAFGRASETVSELLAVVRALYTAYTSAAEEQA
jgi:hypothetical protein